MNRNIIAVLSVLSVLLVACGGDSEVASEAVTETTKVAATVAATATITATQVATTAATVAATATPTEAVDEDLSEYIVVAGDNLTDIAARYGLTLDQLRALNPDVEGDVLWVGQVLKVTGDPPPVTAAATATTAAATATTAAATATAAATPVATVASTGSNPYSSLPAAGVGSGAPPFVPYGSNAGSGALVTASANGLLCGSVNADIAGQWFMRIEDSCTTAGELVNFSSDGKSGLGLYAVGASADVDLN